MLAVVLDCARFEMKGLVANDNFTIRRCLTLGREFLYLDGKCGGRRRAGAKNTCFLTLELRTNRPGLETGVPLIREVSVSIRLKIRTWMRPFDGIK